MTISPDAWPTAIAPHAKFGIEGLLYEASRNATPTDAVTDMRDRLTDIVSLLIDWGDAQKIEAHVDDHRFLVLDFTGADGVERFVQIWAEPALEPIIEVGPGPREDPALQAVAEVMAPALAERGFHIAGNGHNFRTRLRVPRPEDARTISSNLLDLLTGVCGFDGKTNLECRFVQETHDGHAYVMHNVSRERLLEILKGWEFRTQCRPESPRSVFAMLDTCAFEIYLDSPTKEDPVRHTELHCFTAIGIRDDHVARVLREVHTQPNLLRAWPLPMKNDAGALITITTGMEMRGGVTPYHLRLRLRRWVAEVRAIREAFGEAMIVIEGQRNVADLFQVH